MTSAPTEYPTCCGSEDGDLIYGVDPAERGQHAVVTCWNCHTCGTLTILRITKTEENT